MYQNFANILLVEDNVNDAELTIRNLKKNNLANELVHLSDGEEALEFIFCTGQYEQRKIQQQAKIILLDINMPKINGLQVLARVKSDLRTKTIPVVMLTSSKEDPDIKTAYELGANSYIVKPVNFERFAEAIRHLGYYWLLFNQPPV